MFYAIWGSECVRAVDGQPRAEVVAWGVFFFPAPGYAGKRWCNQSYVSGQTDNSE